MSCASDLISLNPSCPALKGKGGLKKRVWAIPFDLIESMTFDGNGNIDTISIAVTSPIVLMKKYIGKKLKNNGVFTGEVGENTNTVKQDLNLVLYFYSQPERDAIDNLFQTEEVIVFVETEKKQIECWGFDTGLTPSALTGGSGTNLNDSTAVTITLSGSQDGLPKVCEFGADLAESIAYLDNLSDTV